MAVRQRYLYDNEVGKWLPANEVIAKRKSPEPAFSFTVYKGGFNHSLGGYCGSKSDERSLQSKIENETGSRPEFIGDARLSNEGSRKGYDVRDSMQRVS